jgi:hypothetical protein
MQLLRKLVEQTTPNGLENEDKLVNVIRLVSND